MGSLELLALPDFEPISQEIARVLGTLCQKLGSETKCIHLIMYVHPEISHLSSLNLFSFPVKWDNKTFQF
jgi:hypothetical protein